MSGIKHPSKNDILVMKTLFNYILNKPMTITLDTYMYETFKAFVYNKKRDCIGYG